MQLLTEFSNDVKHFVVKSDFLIDSIHSIYLSFIFCIHYNTSASTCQGFSETFVKKICPAIRTKKWLDKLNPDLRRETLEHAPPRWRRIFFSRISPPGTQDTDWKSRLLSLLPKD
jgi:hypothetical protein